MKTKFEPDQIFHINQKVYLLMQHGQIDCMQACPLLVLLVSIEMLIMSVIGVIDISRHFFNSLVGMGSRSHDGFLISSSDTLFKTFILDLISVLFLHWSNVLYFIWKVGKDSFNFIHTILGEMITE